MYEENSSGYILVTPSRLIEACDRKVPDVEKWRRSRKRQEILGKFQEQRRIWEFFWMFRCFMSPPSREKAIERVRSGPFCDFAIIDSVCDDSINKLYMLRDAARVCEKDYVILSIETANKISLTK